MNHVGMPAGVTQGSQHLCVPIERGDGNCSSRLVESIDVAFMRPSRSSCTSSGVIFTLPVCCMRSNPACMPIRLLYSKCNRVLKEAACENTINEPELLKGANANITLNNTVRISEHVPLILKCICFEACLSHSLRLNGVLAVLFAAIFKVRFCPMIQLCKGLGSPSIIKREYLQPGFLGGYVLAGALHLRLNGLPLRLDDVSARQLLHHLTLQLSQVLPVPLLLQASNTSKGFPIMKPQQTPRKICGGRAAL